MLTGEQHFFVCYLVIRRGFMGVYKAIPRLRMGDMKLTNTLCVAKLRKLLLRNRQVLLFFKFPSLSSSAVTINSFP